MRIIKSLAVKASTAFRLQNLSRYHYNAQTQTRPNQRPSRLQEEIQQYAKQRLAQKIDPSYWDPILPNIQASAAKLITTMLNAKSSPNQINRQLQQYLQFRNTTFTQNVRSDLGCAAVLVAMKSCSSSEKNEQYEHRIVDFVTLSDIKSSEFDSTMLRYLMAAISKRVTMNVQKNIRQYYRMKLVEILMDNFQRIENKDMLLLVKIIDECIEKDRNNFITKWRFYPLVQSVFQRIFSMMQSYTSTKDYQTRKLIDTIISSFYSKIMHLIYYYDYMTEKDAQVLYKFITTYEYQMYSDYRKASNLFGTLCYLPYVEMQGGSGRTTARRLLIGYIQAQYSDYSSLRKGWENHYATNKRFTVQRCFEDEFHSVFKSLPFQKHEDKYLLLRKQDLVKPQIPQFIWQLIKQNQKQYLEKYILSQLIANIYPERVSLPKAQWPPVLQKRNASWTAENESNLKIWQALQKLGYEFKKQQLCAGRQIDVLINNQIALEVDGEGHYMFLTNEIASQTSARNLQILLSGYKLVVISMFEYNNNRKLQDLENLLREKIELVTKHGYVYVC